MTVKVHYSNYFLIILLVGIFISCSSTKYTLDYTSTFTGYSYEGEHTRALFVKNNLAFVAGRSGVVSVIPLEQSDENNLRQTVIEDVEDFRDIYFSGMNATILMNAGKNGIIWVIDPSGNHKKVFDTTGIFLDGMDFWDDNNGIVYGDPVNGQFFLAKTENMGRSWQTLNPKTFPKALDGEAGFAASGTGIQTIGDSIVYFATGAGETARLFCSYDRGNNWIAKKTPIRSGHSFGIYSMYFWSKNEGIIVGGSYIDSSYNENICQYTKDGGDKWENRSNGLLGYCSCVHGNENGSLIVTTGRLGTYYSLDKGKKWTILSTNTYYSTFVTETHIVLTGKNGKIEFFEYSLIPTKK